MEIFSALKYHNIMLLDKVSSFDMSICISQGRPTQNDVQLSIILGYIT